MILITTILAVPQKGQVSRSKAYRAVMAMDASLHTVLINIHLTGIHVKMEHDVPIIIARILIHPLARPNVEIVVNAEQRIVHIYIQHNGHHHHLHLLLPRRDLQTKSMRRRRRRRRNNIKQFIPKQAIVVAI